MSKKIVAVIMMFITLPSLMMAIFYGLMSISGIEIAAVVSIANHALVGWWSFPAPIWCWDGKILVGRLNQRRKEME